MRVRSGMKLGTKPWHSAPPPKMFPASGLLTKARGPANFIIIDTRLSIYCV